MIQAKRSFVKCGDWCGAHELAILSYATVCLHLSVSLNNEEICEFNEHKIAVGEKSAGLRSGNSLDLNSCSVLESVSSRRNISVLRHALQN